MINVEGKNVFTELAELVEPAHTALILVDMQRDFCLPDGAFAALDVDLSMYPAATEQMIDLLAAARQAGVRHTCRAPPEHGPTRAKERLTGADSL